MTRIAICGVGNIGKVHVENLLSTRGCAISGIFDARQEELQRVADHFGLRAYENADGLFDDPGVQAVIIATPTSSHLQLCQRALRAKKHVFLEKPLAGTLEDAAAIVEASKSSDRVLQIGFCERFNAQYLEARRAVKTGSLGRIRAIQSSRLVPYHMGDPSWELGIFDTAVHNLDLVLWLMDRTPVSVLTKAARVYSDSNIPHTATILLSFEDGSLAVDHITWLKQKAHPLSQCARSQMFIQGENGAFQIDLMDRPSSLTSDERFQKVDSVVLGGGEYYGCLKLQFEYFLRSVEEGAPVQAPVQDAFTTERIAMAALASLHRGCEVELAGIS